MMQKLRRMSYRSLAVWALLLWGAAPAAWAAWPQDGVGLSTATARQVCPASVPAGPGGSSGTWEAHQTMLITTPCASGFDWNRSIKLMFPLRSGGADPRGAINIGFGIGFSLAHIMEDRL